MSLIDENDDGDGVAADPATGLTRDSRLTKTLPPGVYFIILTQYDNFYIPSGDTLSRQGQGNFTGTDCRVPGGRFILLGTVPNCVEQRSRAWAFELLNVNAGDDLVLFDPPTNSPRTSTLNESDIPITRNITITNIASAGTGSGTVTSFPAGINCSNDECAAIRNEGSQVTLTAQPADGSTFTGWRGGGCNGTSPCTVTLSESVSVTATFDIDSSPDVPSVNVPSPNPLSQTAGYSGSWYDPSHNGEGFVIEIHDNNKALIYWFTYDRNGDQAWVIGNGTIDGQTISVGVALIFRGEIFGPGFNPASVISETRGT